MRYYMRLCIYKVVHEAGGPLASSSGPLQSTFGPGPCFFQTAPLQQTAASAGQAAAPTHLAEKARCESYDLGPGFDWFTANSRQAFNKLSHADSPVCTFAHLRPAQAASLPARTHQHSCAT